MKRKAPLASLLVLALATAALAQDRAPALMVPGDKQSEPLAVQAVAVDVRLVGRLAETKMTLTFANGGPRVLAGDLYFPLPEGSTVTGYALDIGGRMVPGVVVEKDRGRQVFESVVRQGIDPGLVEWVKGNNFKTRVFPIPAHGTRTVRVEYVSQLTFTGRGGLYTLPLNFRDKLKSFSIRVTAAAAPAAPALASGPDVALRFERQADGSFVAEGSAENQPIDRGLTLAVPGADEAGVIVEKAPDGQFYFIINDVAIPKAAEAAPAKAPGRVVVFWDASGSRSRSDHARELKLLSAWLGRFKDAAVEVTLLVFRNAVERPQTFTIGNGDAGKLIDAIKAVQYDGGTRLAAVATPPADAAPNAYLLFTDGLNTFGAETFPAFDAPLYVFADSPSANHVLLRHLAARAGGQYFNLSATQAADDAAIAESIGSQPFSFLSADADAADAPQLYPRVATPVAGERFTLVGQLRGQTAKVTLNYGAGGRATMHHAFELSRDKAVAGNLACRYWAMRKVDELSVAPERNWEDIVTVGKQYSIVTPFTSLIVLDRLEQYLQYGITPPPEMGDAVRDGFAAEIALRRKAEDAAKRKQIEDVLAMWKERTDWWDKSFKYDKNFKYKQTGDATGGDTGVTPAAGDAPAPRPAAPPEGAAPPRSQDQSVTTPAENSPAREPDAPGGVGGGRGASGAALDGKDDAGRSGGQPGIALKPWDPKTPYIIDLRAAKPAQRFDVYMHFRKDNAGSPAFYLDCADYFYSVNEPELGMQVLSNIAELELENAALLRVLGHRLAQLGRLDEAVEVFEQVRKMRPEEPQSWRDLALVLADRAERGRVASDYQRAMEMLDHVVMNKWERFEGIEVIALMELNRLWAKFGRELPDQKIDPPFDRRLIRLLDVDLRIVMTWDADQTDMDLWVTEPSAEKCFYSHNRTTIGGYISRDFTQGYGPEEYFVRKAMTGTYKVQANYYGSRSVELLGPVTLQLDVYTHYGRADEQRKSVTLRLKDAKETVDVADVEF